jgi:hypothetical protein
VHFQLEFAIPQLCGFRDNKLEFHVCFVSNCPSTTSICHPIICKVPIKDFRFSFVEFHIYLVLAMHLQFELVIAKFGSFPTFFNICKLEYHMCFISYIAFPT